MKKRDLVSKESIVNLSTAEHFKKDVQLMIDLWQAWEDNRFFDRGMVLDTIVIAFREAGCTINASEQYGALIVCKKLPEFNFKLLHGNCMLEVFCKDCGNRDDFESFTIHSNPSEGQHIVCNKCKFNIEFVI